MKRIDANQTNLLATTLAQYLSSTLSCEELKQCVALLQTLLALLKNYT